MILVISKIAGVGCSTLAYNISKLLRLPLYVQKKSYLYQNEMIRDTSNIQLIDDIDTDNGVIDYGSTYEVESESRRFPKIVNKCKTAIVPFQIGFDSIDKTIDSMVDVRTINPDIKIVLVLNKLNPSDSETELKVKNNFIESLKEKLEEVEIRGNKLIKFDGGYYDNFAEEPLLINFSNPNNIVLTYMRNSYVLTGIPPRSYELTSGEYFLDLFKYEKRRISEKKDKKTGEKREYDIIDKNESYEEVKDKSGLSDMDFQYFRYLFFRTINSIDKKKLKKDGKSVIKTEDEDKYIQEKDFVAFRNKSLRRMNSGKDEKEQYIFIDERFHDFVIDTNALTNNHKVIKDFAFIVYEATSTIKEKFDNRERFYYFSKPYDLPLKKDSETTDNLSENIASLDDLKEILKKADEEKTKKEKAWKQSAEYKKIEKEVLERYKDS